jgi:hypothetical protein
MKERAGSSGVRALGLLGAPWWETVGRGMEASESSVRSRWAGRLCRATLEGSARAFGRVVGLNRDRPIMLILRLSRTDPPSTRSLRRPIEDVLAFAA